MSTFEQVTEQAKAACAANPGVTYTVHPAWCDDTDCRGEHNGTVTSEYLPATGGLPRVDYERGTHFPAVGVALAWDTLDQLDPCVLVHVSGAEHDAQLDLRPREARALAAAILEAADRLDN